MKTCDCHVPGRPATHKTRAGWLLCALSAARTADRLALNAARQAPEPIGSPTLFDEAS